MRERSLIILSRHGNTFEAGEKVVMVGASQDPPLTEHGRGQAQRLAEALSPWAVHVSQVVSGPLRRTSEFAEILRATLAPRGLRVAQVQRDERLRELDYGAWSGLSNAEIQERYGEEALHAWLTTGERPSAVGVVFSPPAEQVRSEVASLVRECAASPGISILVTSNGIAREVGPVLSGDASRSWSLKTGNSALLEYSGDACRVIGWDLPPDGVVALLERGPSGPLLQPLR